MKIIVTAYMIAFFSLNFANARYYYGKIEIDLDKNCKEEKVVSAFRASKKVDFVKPDFEAFGDRELEIAVVEGEDLSNAEIKDIARSANCEVLFVKRK
jgi:hypothetical protein